MLFRSYLLMAVMLVAGALIGRRSPVAKGITSVLAFVVIFGAGFIARPLGAWLMGIYADRGGRRAALTLSVALMILLIAHVVFALRFG